ncbi:MAG: thiolase domain-containing protein [Candidatus Dojkabacteria bacterium]|nr:MAG: thiolase domain-containing protein [Candidatus Dojkabacteria bacterium]
MKKVYVSGAGMTRFGELWKEDLRSLAIDAAKSALQSAEIERKAIDAIFVANMGSSSLSGQDHLGSLIASQLDINVPAFRIEAACASGGVAINLAKSYMLANNCKNVLVIGVEKMTDVSANDVTKVLARAADEEYEAYFGATFPSLYAMMARAYMSKFGLTKEQLAEVSVKNHFHGTLNEKAQFQKEITVEDVVGAPAVADPLGLLDCSPITDGAAGIVLSVQKSKIQLLSSQVSTGSISLQNRPSFTSIDATVRSADLAFKEAGISRKNIGLVELHDCFSIAEIIAYEDLGFAKEGKGFELIEDKSAYRDGALPVNTSGGLKSCGHPVGATGIKQVVEIFEQMTGQAGKRQLANIPNFALAHNVGGSGGTSVVSIFANV